MRLVRALDAVVAPGALPNARRGNHRAMEWPGTVDCHIRGLRADRLQRPRVRLSSEVRERMVPHYPRPLQTDLRGTLHLLLCRGCTSPAPLERRSESTMAWAFLPPL